MAFDIFLERMINLSKAPESAGQIMGKIRETVNRVMVLPGEDILELMLAAVICRGHILLDDIPGVGKTMLARTFSSSLGLNFKRIQFTPDLLPADVTGMNIFNQKEREFNFRPGPVFTNILLADEINRATPRTQSSLLESMQEATVTIDGETHRLQDPFLVLATQNPVEMEGTFPLPEAQLDRFLFCLRLGYPSADGEREIVNRFINDNPLKKVQPIAGTQEVQWLREAAKKVYLAPPVQEYLVSLSRNTRELEDVRLGASPRGTLYLARAAQAVALIRGRDYVLPDDVQDVAEPVLAHRLLTAVSSAVFEVTGQDLVEKALKNTPVPVGPFAEGEADAT